MWHMEQDLEIAYTRADVENRNRTIMARRAMQEARLECSLVAFGQVDKQRYGVIAFLEKTILETLTL